MSNALASAASPYLRQHRDNPVAWLQWGPQAFNRAAAEDKPILLSIGYAACHWCHVMAHESFEDEATARLMNEKFVSVKVDREERPDLDQVYQTALAALDGQGGWPLTMFLGADGAPFWGGTYFPPEARWGRPGFRDILARVAKAYHEVRGDIRSGSRDLAARVAAYSQPESEAARLSTQTLDGAAAALASAMDPLHGGFRGAPKFPQLSAVELVWRASVRGDRAAGEAATRALDRMCQGGIYDHLGGGFARYTVDEAWLVPHFEKMLYDNAQFVALLSQVWLVTRRPLYAVRVRETIAWLEAEMTDGAGAFVSSFDADSEGEEGRFYVWRRAEVDRLLGPAAAAFREAYGVSRAGNWEGTNILNRLKAPELRVEIEEAALARSRELLLTARRGRVPPTRDDKILADCNGLMIGALVEASGIAAEPHWLDLAERAFAAVLAAQGDGARLSHSSCAGQTVPLGFLDDYAAMARAALLLHEATGKPEYLETAVAWMGELDNRYRDPLRGGYYYAAADGDPRLPVRPRHARDSAQPSGNALAADALARLFLLTGDAAWSRRADEVFNAFAGDAARMPAGGAALLNAYDFYSDATHVVVMGQRGAQETGALVAAARALPTPNRAVSVVPPGTQLPAGHPAAGKSLASGLPTAYVCGGQRCAAPATTASDLFAAWETLR